MDDSELLRSYIETGSERAFAELVQKRLPLVYSAALRQTGDPHRAQEVTQMVFTDLARKAKKLVDHPALIAWLHRSTKWAACDLRRAERRRGIRDGAALQLGKSDVCTQNVDWEQLRPAIDESLDKLVQLDRAAVLLRFFEGLRYAEVGTRLNMSEVAARIRVKRALAKLQTQLVRRGITSAASALSILLANNVIAAVPNGIAQTVTISALNGIELAQGTIASFKAVLFSKFQLATYSLCLVLVGSFLWQQRGTEQMVHRLHDAEERDKSLRKELLEAQRKLEAEQAAFNLVASSMNYTPRPKRPLSAREQERAKWMPAARQLELDSTYAPLFRHLRLEPDRLETLKLLLVERKQALYDAQQLAGREGLLNPMPTMTEWRQLQCAAAVEVDEQIRILLGEPAYAYYTDYQSTDQMRRKLREVEITLRRTATPPRDEQVDQIAELLKTMENQKPNSVSSGFGGRFTDAELQAATTVLDAAQMEILYSINSSKEALVKLNRLNGEAVRVGKVELRQNPPLPKAKLTNSQTKAAATTP